MADTNTVRTLTVRQIQDASAYVAGAKEFVAANKDMASSSSVVGTVVSQTQAKISNAADPISRLVRSYDQSSAAAIKFNNELSVLNKQLEAGKISADVAGRIYAGMVKSFGTAADGADLMAKGFINLGTVVSNTNAEIVEFFQATRAIEEAAAETEIMTQRAAALKAQIDPLGTSQAKLNAELAEYSALLKAGYVNLEQFTKLELQAKQRHDELAASLARTPANDNLRSGNQNFQATNLAFQLQDVATTAAFMPWYTVALQQGPQAAAALQGMERPVQGLLSAFSQMVNPVSLVTIGLIGAGAAAIHYFTSGETAAKSFDTALKEHRETLEGIKAVYGELSADAVTKFTLGGKTFVDASMRTDLAGLQKEMQAQQKDVLTQMAPMGDFGKLSVLTGAQTNFSDDVLKFLSAVQQGNPDVATFNDNIEKTYQTLMQSNPESPELLRNTADGLEAIAASAIEVKGEFADFSAPINKFKSDVAAGRDGFLDFQKNVEEIGKAKGIEDQAAKLITFGQKLLEINAYLIDLKKKMDETFDDRGPGGFLLSQGPTNQRDANTSAIFDSQQQVAIDRAEQAYKAQIATLMARTPVEKQNAARDSAAAQYNEGESQAIRDQRIELAGTQALIAAEHDLRVAKDERVRSSQAALDQAQYELSLVGKTVEERNRLMAAYQAEAQIKEANARDGASNDEKEIAAAREKAAAIADINAKLQGQKLLTDQQDQIEQLQLQSRLIGANADEVARETATLQAQQQLRQQGIELLSREGQQYVANAAAMAQARQEIDRQNAAYQSLQQAEGDAIDTLVTGSGSMKDVLKNATSWLEQMAVVNPLKNSLTGTNLPTLGDLFAGRPSIPGATSTAMMQVNATTVMVNGSPVGGLPGLPGTAPGGLAGLIGLPANQNALNATSPSSLISAANQNAPAAASLAGIVANAGQTRTGIPLSTITTTNGLTANVNSQYAGNFQGFINDLQSRGYDISSIGGYNYRNIAGTDTLSNHAFGNAIDINPAQNPVTYPGRGQSLTTNMPSDVSSIASQYGLAWGGDWHSKQDPMHFEVQKGAQPLDTTQVNSSLSKLSTTTSAASTNLSTFGDQTKSVTGTLTDFFNKPNTPQPGSFPSAPMGANYFPPAPGAGFGFSQIPIIGPLFSGLSGLFSLFGFADGSDSTPEGWSLVGERGPELRYNSRGSKIVPNHKLNQVGGGGGGNVSVAVGVTVDDSGSLKAYVKSVSQSAAQDAAMTHSAAMLQHYDANVLPGRVQDIQQNPRSVG